jgi:hypothetical protein
MDSSGREQSFTVRSDKSLSTAMALDWMKFDGDERIVA